MDDTEYMTAEQALSLINSEEAQVQSEIVEEERETGLNYKLLKSE